MATPAGFEPATPGLGILCSILLSYGAWTRWYLGVIALAVNTPFQPKNIALIQDR